MTVQLLFPRLSNLGVDQLLLDPFREADLDLHTDSAPAFVSWAATGGRRVTSRELMKLRASICQIAAASGFPGGGGQIQRASFDEHCSQFLVEASNIPIGEGLRDDLWAYLAVVLLRDVCVWRFPTPPKERLYGGVRNTLQRLWLRGIAFDRGPNHEGRWKLLAALSEDAMVQIIERPSVASNPVLARAIAECWVKASHKVGRASMEGIMRDAVRNIRIANEVVFLAALRDAELSVNVSEYFDTAIRNLKSAEDRARRGPTRGLEGSPA